MAYALSTDQTAPSGADWLTGLPTRGDCVSALSSLLTQLPDSSDEVGVLWINVDRFSKINHSFGHGVGDSVLVELARRLERAKPVSGTLGRMGSDEFALFFRCRGEADAESMARSVQSELGLPIAIGRHLLRPSISIGAVVSRFGETASDLLEQADRLSREAKLRGVGHYLVRSLTQASERGGKVLAREELDVEEMLHRSLEYGGLFLHYQPIVDLADGKPIAIEALMRCQTDGRSMPPAQFIPVAEKTGLIMHLGEWSLSTAAAYACHLVRQGTPMTVAVNISRAQLLTPAFSKTLHGVLAHTGLAPSLLELELTESLFMDRTDVVHRNLQAVIETGVTLALDDFGTGYSSLACLKDLPANKIKLDRAFVTGLPHDRRSFGVAKAVAQLASDLDVTLVAEGVETREQYEAMREAGIGAVQGFYVARPLAETALEEWLASGWHDE